MIFQEQNIKGVYLVTPEPFSDERGSFMRNYCQKEFSNNGLDKDIKQANLSYNKSAYTLRGFHYQLEPFQEAKTMTCVDGEIYDVVLDLRKESDTYKKWFAATLNTQNRLSIHVPKGCANAFLTMKNNTLVHYYSSQIYSPEHERGVNFKDPSFNFEWPTEPLIISEKDNNHPFIKI
jgi:dTDP-4-dehydrorhamnose 3,5-epimerase